VSDLNKGNKDKENESDSKSEWFQLKYTVLSVLLSCAPIILALYLITITQSKIDDRLERIEQKEERQIKLTEEEKEFQQKHTEKTNDKNLNKPKNHNNTIFRPRPRNKQ
jgi:hypothetical protein